MAVYQAPIRDMRFVLHELMSVEDLAKLEGYEDATPDLIDAVLEEAGKVTENVLFPLNRSGDEEGCVYENGVVRTPSGFKEAYSAFVEGGWPSLNCDPAFGGQGLPHTVSLMVSEMICSANLSFGMYPGLSHGAYSALAKYGTDELKETYLPKLVDGTWSGTMCLTEPHCGTDLGLCRTKAEPLEDGSYDITGTKIFISAGEHDLTDNILHLVLARTPDAPKGIKGISLFLVPKFLPNPDGTPGARNGVMCGAIEHKMGIKASSTCVMNFDGAKGWLVGSLNKGMRAMFTMMNEARLLVGIQGLGLGSVSYQGAVAYAKERTQGRSLSGVKHPDKSADPIIVHPDVRRMLLTQRAYAEGCRALGAWVAKELDISHKHSDAARREEADDFVQLMTPIVKALFTDMGYESANIGMQVLGGHGFIREHGMEQYVRDCRIAQIYEGTNGIQALDLIGRKLPAHAGRYLRRFFHPVQSYIEANIADERLAEFVQPLAKAFVRLQQATAALAQKGMSNQEEAASTATDYLRLFGLVAMSYMWCKAATVALDKLDEDKAFYQAKLDTARFFTAKILPQTGALFSTLMAGGDTLMAMDEDAF
ncbi:acyl-CoA dehydrogenase C-terminal domain-containing protein [Aestuariispira insulae]|uniref:3-methylmercaptopropionyl-CoA dehydrogenase n=1 Tax=Aestuariispira insulae TaxID=1461337 RepID=A0A3D9H5G0_9PROT|nr:acyl-CoA dehydrogenase C-terminal domain-containing protein [Aestuariispira insulae]RED44669.1 alkylation response protein AidB-like acyl-CoA dehydrogenase [Aestuariispira insulae]